MKDSPFLFILLELRHVTIDHRAHRIIVVFRACYRALSRSQNTRDCEQLQLNKDLDYTDRYRQSQHCQRTT